MLLLVTVHKGHLVPVAALEFGRGVPLPINIVNRHSFGGSRVRVGEIRHCIGRLMTLSGLELDNHQYTTKVSKRSSNIDEKKLAYNGKKSM